MARKLLQALCFGMTAVTALGAAAPLAGPSADISLAPDPYAGREVLYPELLAVEATAYTNGPESTGKGPGDPGYGITASGEPTYWGAVAVDPAHWAFGQPFYVPDFRHTFTALDTGTDVRGRARLDIWMEAAEQARAFGRRQIAVYVPPVVRRPEVAGHWVH